MKTRITIFFIYVFAFFFFGTKAEAQESDPAIIVSKFADFMTQWSKTRKDDYYIKLLELFPSKQNNSGYEKCLVNDRLLRIFADKDETGCIPDGFHTSDVDSYLIELHKSIEKGMKYKHKQPVWLKQFEYPSANQTPVHIVSMDFSTSGSVNYSGTDLFFVQGDYIIKIIDYEYILAKWLKHD